MEFEEKAWGVLSDARKVQDFSCARTAVVEKVEGMELEWGGRLFVLGLVVIFRIPPPGI